MQWVLRILVLAAGLPFAVALADSGVYVDIRANDSPDAPVVERWKLYGASHALVIGIDNYTNGWPRLSNAIKDARLVGAALEGRGFDVEYLIDPTSAAMRGGLRQFLAIKGADPDARLFIWYAGHGHTENEEGYLVPADAPAAGRAEFRLKALHMGDVGSMVRIAQAKHVLAVFDSCFAGTIFGAKRSRPPAAITRAAVQPARQFLTSGDADQQVSDDGTFRKLFLQALQGGDAADANNDGYLTATEMSLHIEDRMINLTQAQQTPRSGKLRDAKFDRGDFVFLLPRTAALTAPATQDDGPGDAVFDLAFWDSIKDSNDPADYQAYLEAFPRGRFASLAGRRAQGAAPAPLPPAAPEQEARLTPPEVVAPFGSTEGLEAYLRDNERDLKRKLYRYNRNAKIATSSAPYDWSEVTINSWEIKAIEGERAFVEINFGVGKDFNPSFGLAVFELIWRHGGLEFAGHQLTSPGLAALPSAQGEALKNFVEANRFKLGRQVARILKRDVLQFSPRARVTEVHETEIIDGAGNDYVVALSYTVTSAVVSKIGKAEFEVRFENGQLDILRLVREIR